MFCSYKLLVFKEQSVVITTLPKNVEPFDEKLREENVKPFLRPL